MPIRTASSIVLRRGPDDPRVFLARRAWELRFFGGYWAFCGGTVSSQDRENAALVTGAKPEDAASLFCAARECLEELGIDLTCALKPPGRAAGSTAGSTAGEDARAGVGEESRRAARESTLQNPDDYPRWLRERGTTIPGDRFQPLVRLLTPQIHPVRYDTQFYLVDLNDWPDAGEPSIWPGELIDGEWREPAEWLSRWRSGEDLIAPPVVLILEILARQETSPVPDRFHELTRSLTEDNEIHTIFYSPALQMIPLETPTLPPATHTNAFLIGSDPAYLIDPATPHDEERTRLARALEKAEEDGLVPGRKLRAVILTHYHPDHVGAAEFVRKRYDIPVWAHEETRARLSGSIGIDRLLREGDRIPLDRSPDGRPGWELEVQETPGHAPGHLAFFERRYGSLIAGDMFSTLSSILIHPDDGDMALYMDSLDKLIELPSRVVYPSHGPPAATGRKALEAQRRHRIEREDAIFEAIVVGASDTHAIVSRVYRDTPPELLEHAAMSVESVCRKLIAEGRIRRKSGRLEPDPSDPSPPGP